LSDVILAEIADKMGTAASWWILASFLAVPLVYVAFRVTGKTGMAVVLVLAGGLSFLLTLAAVQEAYFEGEFSLMVRDKLGSQWIAHRIASGCLPVVLVSIALGLRRRWSKQDSV
jgi:hypothetical protein